MITPVQVRLTISEGRYHQVKQMFAAVSNQRYVELHRERIGAITLWMRIWLPGEYRPLTERRNRQRRLTISIKFRSSM